MNNHVTAEIDYVLGTHDDEIRRLGLQHRVWRARMLDAWRDARISEGMHVLDLGCGPGYAALDLAELVGAGGRVVGVERSRRFVTFARGEAARRGLSQVQFVEADLGDSLGLAGEFDAVWCRWVASFVRDLGRLVQTVHAALKPGGRAVFHEYLDYGTWRTIPRSASIEDFVAEVMASWREAQGEPDIARALYPRLGDAGFEVVDARPLVFAVRPGDYLWRWPASFLRSNVRRLVEGGRRGEAWAGDVIEELGRLEQSEDALMITPTVLQLIVRK